MKLYERLIVIFILINIIVSLYVALASGTNGYICDTGAGCDIVQNSPYSSLFGVKLAWFGVITFSLLFAAYLIFKNNYYWVFFSLTTLGFIFALYFIYLQIFVINALCQNCMIIDLLALIIFFLSAYDIHQRTISK